LMRTFEAGVGVMIMLVALIQFVMLSAGRLGEQWDSTSLDVEVKKALQFFQTEDVSEAFKEYSKIHDPDLLRMPESESVGYRILVNGEPVDRTIPPPNVEVASEDARIYYESRDSARLVPSLWTRLRRSQYVQMAGRTLDYDSVDELAALIMAIMWDPDSTDVVRKRLSTLISNQNDDGGWGFVREKESDALCTSMALRAISSWLRRNGKDPLANATVQAGLSWLRSRVHADGGYGSRERIESSVDMTAQALLAYLSCGLTTSDQWTRDAERYLLREQRADGGFPLNRYGRSQIGPTAEAVEALIAANTSRDVIDRAISYIRANQVDQGNYSIDLYGPGQGSYDVSIYTGYVVDCSPRGYDFWSAGVDDSRIMIPDVYGDSSNFTVVLSIDRTRLLPPDNQQKIALAVSHDKLPDTTDWWILNAGNPHTAGQGRQIDSPQFKQSQDGTYTILTITNLQEPPGYDILSSTATDWLLALVGDSSHPIQDNPGKGYLVGYWSPWMKLLPFSNVLAWRAWSPRVNRVCIDVDKDYEFDDKRLTEGDSLRYQGRDWEIHVSQVGDEVNVTATHQELNVTRNFWLVKYNLSTIPESASGLYHFGIISRVNKPLLSRNYKVVLRDSTLEGVYDEAYIWNGSSWNLYRPGQIWNESGNLWLVGIEGDFLTLTHSDPVSFSGLTGRNRLNVTAAGDFLKVVVQRQGVDEVWLRLYRNSTRVREAVLDASSQSFREILGNWGDMRETSKVYRALTLAEDYFAGYPLQATIHQLADRCQQYIKFVKEFNSVVEDEVTIQAWYKSGEGGA